MTSQMPGVQVFLDFPPNPGAQAGIVWGAVHLSPPLHIAQPSWYCLQNTPSTHPSSPSPALLPPLTHPPPSVLSSPLSWSPCFHSCPQQSISQAQPSSFKSKLLTLQDLDLTLLLQLHPRSLSLILSFHMMLLTASPKHSSCKECPSHALLSPTH